MTWWVEVPPQSKVSTLGRLWAHYGSFRKKWKQLYIICSSVDSIWQQYVQVIGFIFIKQHSKVYRREALRWHMRQNDSRNETHVSWFSLFHLICFRNYIITEAKDVLNHYPQHVAHRTGNTTKMVMVKGAMLFLRWHFSQQKAQNLGARGRGSSVCEYSNLWWSWLRAHST